MATAPSATTPDTSGDLDCIIVAEIKLELQTPPASILTDLNAIIDVDDNFVDDVDGVTVVEG